MTTVYFAVLSAICFASMAYYVLEVMLGQQMYEKNKVQTRLESILARKQQNVSISRKTAYSNINSLNRIFKRQRMSQKLYHLLAISGLNVPVSVFIFADLCWGFMVLLITYLLSKSQGTAVVTGLIAGVVPYWMLAMNKKKYIATFTNQFPEALIMMRNALRAGQSIQSSFEIVASEANKPVCTEFSRLIREVELGSNLHEALNLLYKRIQTLDLRIFVLGIFIQQEVGGNLSELLDHIEKTIRERLTLSNEMNALTAQGKMSAIVIIAIPIVLTLAISVLNPQYMQPLYNTEGGKKLLYTAIVLQVIGAAIIRKMTKLNVVS